VYTQCSKCETVFKLSADVLRAAGGQVRCGRCGEVFNALARLAEDSSAFSAGESPAGESPHEMEARADSILESAAALQVVQTVARDHETFGPAEVEIAQLEILDADDNERSMEFTLPPGELDRIFIESKKRAPPASSEAGADPEAEAHAEDETNAAAEAEAEAEAEADAEAEAEGEANAEAAAAAAAASVAEEVEIDAAPHPRSAVADVPALRNRVSGFEVPEDVRRDMQAGFEQTLHEQRVQLESEFRAPGPPNAQRRLILWIGAAVVSALLLMIQVVHQNREWFVAHAHGAFGTGVRALYGAMGAPLPAPANLSAYQLRQWGVTGDPDANGILKVRASILNSAAQLQPYPLLRVTLADRFGKRIGMRDFAPAEYLGMPTARLLTPGERVDATLEILDPGKNAEGFEIDVCLRGVDQRISCANDVATQAAQ
jgi:predicted Zn finger-like uncharacterized protein